jgi:RNA polymerase sigma-70 factor (ECF subfamily)
MDASDSHLVTQAQAGSADAFAQLVERHRPRLVRLNALMIGDWDEAESLAQEALTRAFAQLDGFRNALPFSAWLRGIALNVCRNHLRARVRHARPVAPEALSEAPAPAGRQQGVLSSILRNEIGDHTSRAIAQLPLPLREAFVLHFIEGLDYGEMSELAGVAAGTLRVRAHRARALLRDSLGPVVDTWMREGGERGT